MSNVNFIGLSLTTRQSDAPVVAEVDALNVYSEGTSPSLRLSKYLKSKTLSKAEEIKAALICAETHMLECSPFMGKGERVVATLKSRLIVNQAGGILENAGLCLHRHFGYPYIPGSAVKGLARHAAWCEWKAEEDGERKLEIAKKIAEVFGYPTGDEEGLDEVLKPYVKEHAGVVCFMAAEPVGKAPLVMDIVNCHHMEYYDVNDKKLKALDDEASNVQFFPAVESGAKFEFNIVPLKQANANLLECAKAWLVEAIVKYGAGAKTGAGYGWFAIEN